MIKIEKTEVVGWEHAIRGMRNPKNSWDRSDSGYGCAEGRCNYCEIDLFYDRCSNEYRDYIVGPNDHDLMMRLAKGGPVHAKYRRMITVYATITAPLYWWKEMDTYQIGVVKNSCSTMHKIAAKEFTLEDFSCEHLNCNNKAFLYSLIDLLNKAREEYNLDSGKAKSPWWQMIQLLPSSYNQKRTVMLNYEVLAGLYPMRKNHKLDEWGEFCDWIETLPYSEIITGKSKSEEILKIGEALHKGMEKGLVDAWKKANPISQKEVDELTEGWNKLVDKAWKEAFPNDLEDDSSDTHDFLKKELNIASPSERESYPVDWAPPELEKLGIPYPATQEDIEKAMEIEHLVDVTCSWDTEAIINGDRLYEIGPDCTIEDLTPYERYLLDKTKSYQKNDTGV